MYSIYTAFSKEGIPHIIVNPFDVDLSFVDDELDKYISPDKDGLLSDEMYADLAIIGYSLFEENKIVLNEEQRSYLYDKMEINLILYFNQGLTIYLKLSSISKI